MKTKINKISLVITIISCVLYLFSIFLIFYFSLEDGIETKHTSAGIGDAVIGSINQITNDKVTIDRYKFISVLRKIIGHFGLFAFNSFFGYLGFKYLMKKEYINILIVGILGITMSIATEFIQQNISGRFFGVDDIFINVGGVISGIFVIKFIIYLIEKRRKKANLASYS